jgi:hypothetical protein
MESGRHLRSKRTVGAGDRFLMNVLVEDTKPRAITVILNWPGLLKQN